MFRANKCCNSDALRPPRALGPKDRGKIDVRLPGTGFNCNLGVLRPPRTLNKMLEQNEAEKNWDCHFIWVCSATSYIQDALACIGLSHSSLMKYKASCTEEIGFTGKKIKTEDTLNITLVLPWLVFPLLWVLSWMVGQHGLFC